MFSQILIFINCGQKHRDKGNSHQNNLFTKQEMSNICFFLDSFASSSRLETHLFNKYLLSNYYVPSTTVDLKYSAWRQT